MRKIVAVGGVPGTGKTSLFREFIAKHSWEKVEPIKLLSSMYCKELDLYIFGKYEEGEVFAGTDRLSMAVQPSAQEFVRTTTSNVLFEGDRIFNRSFLEFVAELPEVDLQVIYLKVPQAMLEERYADRGSNQSDVFLKGRETKYSNILANFGLMEYIQEFFNRNIEEQTIVLNHLDSIFIK
jgi:broad-specificity NMP kinase